MILQSADKLARPRSRACSRGVICRHSASSISSLTEARARGKGQYHKRGLESDTLLTWLRNRSVIHHRRQA
jgi:hypothetical protein